MATLHNFAVKIETGWTTRKVKPILETRNDNGSCMYVWFTFPDIKYLFGASNICELQLSAINHKTCSVLNLVIMTLGDTSTHATHNILGKVCHIILKQN